MPPHHTITIGLVLVITMTGSAQAQVSPGDMNCDRTMDGLDVAPFTLALTDPVAYQAAFPNCDLSYADLNCDSSADTDDIFYFVRCLVQGGCPACMVPVPGGSFEMGDSFGEGLPRELPVHTVYLSPYYIDTYEVTNQQYADGLNWAWAQGGLIEVTGGGVVKKAGDTEEYCDTTTSNVRSRITWSGSTFGITSGKEDHPMVQVEWYGSVAYANWRSGMEGKPLCYDLSSWRCNFGSGYRLPTEAEWEKAARGGVAGHRFPWSDQDTIQHARCNYQSSSNYPYDTSPTRGVHPCWGVLPYPYTSPVGFFTGALQYKADWGWPGAATSYQTASGVNGYGLHDMAGNVWEWCHDYYLSTYYSSSPASNPTGPTSGVGHILRGGGWSYTPRHCRCADRYDGYYPGTRYSRNGLRLALGSP